MLNCVRFEAVLLRIDFLGFIAVSFGELVPDLSKALCSLGRQETPNHTASHRRIN